MRSELLASLLLAAGPGAEPPPPPEAQLISPLVLEALLPALEQHDTAGLGAQSRALRACAPEGAAVYLRRTKSGGWELADCPVSPALSLALRCGDSYLGMTQATVARPPTFEELRAAALSAEGVRSIAVLFEKTIAEPLETPSGSVRLELGGEALLDRGRLVLREIRDPTRPALRRLAAAARDGDAVERLYRADAEGARALDPAGILDRALSLRALRRTVPGAVDAVLLGAVDAVLRNAAMAYNWEPSAQLAEIVSRPWSGRYLGPWHLHVPHRGTAGWTESDGPSFPDMEIAVSQGQSLVLAFHPEGFDLYDLSPLSQAAPDLSKTRKISHRSAAWRARFARLAPR